MKTHCLRLLPGQDLKKEISNFCHSEKITAACVLSAVGSLKVLKLRLANAQSLLEKEEYFEILSLNGTLSIEGLHLHMAVADQKGMTLGGHLVDGNLIYTTCELVILELDEYIFARELDLATKFKEIKISKK